MRLWKILLALLLALTGSSPSALASIPLAQENLCTGHFRGVVSGLRYYNPAQGRWINRDPIEEDGGNNLFAFVRHNPIGAVDPLGNFTILDTLLSSSEDAGTTVVDIKQGNSLVNMVKGVIQAEDNLQQFEAGVEAANGLNVEGLLVDIQNAQGAIMGGLRGVRTAEKAADDLHHIFSRAGNLMDLFKRNGVNPNGVLGRMDSVLHQYGLHQPGTGGQWNQIWQNFDSEHQTMENNPYFVIGFGFGLIDQASGAF